uniref:NADH dehydrogenase subunit 5 n=1 Tax=Pallenopsis patagonica TaxID=648475 RepID=UPI00226CA7FE|nr:NADH dehydrogenase subunit 5 [Pallenopsis patagonica]UZA61345.1 NADH dehydrogenase subunit 5 [Pallenopsis patagonica]
MFFYFYNVMKLISLILLLLSLVVFYIGMIFLYINNVVYLDWSMYMINGVDMSFVVVLDYYSLFFCSFVLFISSSVFLFSENYMIGDSYLYRFVFLLLLFVISMLLLIFSGNLLSLLLGWDGLGLVSFLLVIYYQNKSSLSGGLLTLLTNRLGDAALILGICLLFMYGNFSMMYLSFIYFDEIIMVMIIMAAMTKSAQLPFSAWLPAAMAAPTPVSSLVHSSTLVTAGVYLLIRFYSVVCYFNLGCYLLYISIFTMLMSGVSANFEFDFKKVIALSTLSQLGVMMMSLSLGLMNLTYFHLLTHAMFKALMFLCAGSIMHGYFGNQDMRMKGSSLIFSPYISMSMNLSVLSLCGMPFLSGYYSKDLILEKFFMMEFNLFMMFLLFMATCFTIIYSYRLCLFVFFNYNLYNSCFYGFESGIVLTSLMMLTMGSIFGGFMLSWLIFPIPVLVFLPFYFKFMVFLIFFLSLLLSVIFNYTFMFINKVGSLYKNVVVWFLGQMWFISSLSGQFLLMYPFCLSFSILKVFDLGLSEMYGGRGMYKSLIQIGGKFNGLNYYSLLYYYLSFLLWFMLIFMFYMFV